mmetsp:Transcript_1343/g.4007  ORF Transcript_1343/g.4007 Transcript_1343/m.4007 type:complete len:219 (+) Transcript_1343:193-849(+)
MSYLWLKIAAFQKPHTGIAGMTAQAVKYCIILAAVAQRLTMAALQGGVFGSVSDSRSFLAALHLASVADSRPSLSPSGPQMDAWRDPSQGGRIRYSGPVACLAPPLSPPLHRGRRLPGSRQSLSSRLVRTLAASSVSAGQQQLSQPVSQPSVTLDATISLQRLMGAVAGGASGYQRRRSVRNAAGTAITRSKLQSMQRQHVLSHSVRSHCCSFGMTAI